MYLRVCVHVVLIMALFACCLDEDTKASMRVSRAIDRELLQWKRDSSKEFKLLLLGKHKMNQSYLNTDLGVV